MQLGACWLYHVPYGTLKKIAHAVRMMFFFLVKTKKTCVVVGRSPCTSALNCAPQEAGKDDELFDAAELQVGYSYGQAAWPALCLRSFFYLHFCLPLPALYANVFRTSHIRTLSALYPHVFRMFFLHCFSHPTSRRGCR
jgi:hypothetical protein